MRANVSRENCLNPHASHSAADSSVISTRRLHAQNVQAAVIFKWLCAFTFPARCARLTCGASGRCVLILLFITLFSTPLHAQTWAQPTTRPAPVWQQPAPSTQPVATQPAAPPAPPTLQPPQAAAPPSPPSPGVVAPPAPAPAAPLPAASTPSTFLTPELLLYFGFGLLATGAILWLLQRVRKTVSATQGKAAEPTSAGFSVKDLQNLKDQGLLSDREYQKALARAQAQAPEPPISPPDTPPQAPPPPPQDPLPPKGPPSGSSPNPRNGDLW